MLGAIAGDIIGSVYEGHPIRTKEFPLFRPDCRFTDDSVLTIAIAKAIMDGSDYLEEVRKIGREYPDAGYGGSFIHWLFSEHPQPYYSWGNGSAMRVSPVGFAFDSEEEVMDEARKTAVFTHNHPEGIKGAQAAALAVFIARVSNDKDLIREEIRNRFDYNLDRTLDEIRPDYRFDISCQGTVPEAIIAFLESNSYEDAVRNAVSLGGDSDTLACITGGIADAFYGGVPDYIREKVKEILTDSLWDITDRFCKKYRTL